MTRKEILEAGLLKTAGALLRLLPRLARRAPDAIPGASALAIGGGTVAAGYHDLLVKNRKHLEKLILEGKRERQHINDNFRLRPRE